MNLENLKSELLVDKEITLSIRDLDQARATFELINSNRDYLREFLPWVDETRMIKDVEEYITYCKESFTKQKNCSYGIFYSGEFIGMVSFVSFSESNHSCEIGYWLGKEFQGNGIITRAVKALVDHAFNDIKLHRIIIRAAVENKPSWSIPERLEFTYEGINHEAELVNGNFYDLKVYGLLNKYL